MFEIIAGPRHNAVGRGVSWGATPTASVAAVSGAGTWSTSFPLANLYDGIPAAYATCSDLLATYSVDIALNIIQCGDGEQATAVGWTGSGATVATSATHAYKGSKSLVVTNSVADTAGYAYQSVTVQAGESLTLEYGIGYPAAGNVRIEVYDARRARYLTSAGAWQASQAYVASHDAASWESGAIAFTSPTVSEWGWIEGDIDVRLYSDPGTGTAAAYGEVLLYPSVDFVGLFGHNAPPNATLSLTSYADWWHGGTATVRATSSALQTPVAWIAASSAIAYPFYRLTIAYPSTARVAPYVGELVIGKRLALTRNPDYQCQIEVATPQSRAETPGGTSWAVSRSQWPRRRIVMPIACRLADYQQHRDSIHYATRGGQGPCVLLPTDIDADLCLLGRISEAGVYVIQNHVVRTTELQVLEDALPTVG